MMRLGRPNREKNGVGHSAAAACHHSFDFRSTRNALDPPLCPPTVGTRFDMPLRRHRAVSRGGGLTEQIVSQEAPPTGSWDAAAMHRSPLRWRAEVVFTSADSRRFQFASVGPTSCSLEDLEMRAVDLTSAVLWSYALSLVGCALRRRKAAGETPVQRRNARVKWA